jgi:HK97 family phage prohead protease
VNNRAYSVLDVKSIDEGQRTISGVATTPTVDRVGDIIEPLGVQFKNPMPFLWQHDHQSPVGTVSFDKPTKDGITFTAKFVDPGTVDSPSLKDRLQMAWDSVKTGLVRAVSIGFRPIEYAFMEDSNGIRFIETEVFELSGVTIPANAEALISGMKGLYGKTEIDIIKAIDAEWRHQAGIPDPEIPVKPEDKAATGKSVCVVKLDNTARDRAPFVINKIHTERKP